MEEKNQKTVVAFIAGLLIGGLLVWVFSIAPQKKNTMGLEQKNDGQMEEQTEGTDEKAGENADAQKDTPKDAEANADSSGMVVADGAGSLVVEDQAAGAKVDLGAVTMPIKNGWIVVHEMNGDALGNILGASRYSDTEGLKPTTVELLRATVPGKTYTVVIYTENGDRVFDKKEDMPVKTTNGAMIQDSFTTK